MSTALHLAGPDDLVRVSRLVAAFHSHRGIVQDDATRSGAILPLLQGSPYGAIWLIGPKSAPLGYVAATFGWSIEMGGLDAFVDEIYLRETVRGRGMGGEALSALARLLKAEGVRAMHLEVARDDPGARRLYGKLGFEPREGYHLMTCRL